MKLNDSGTSCVLDFRYFPEVSVKHFFSTCLANNNAHEHSWSQRSRRGLGLFISACRYTCVCWRRGPAAGGWVCLNVPLLLCLRLLWSSSNLQLSGTHFPHLTDLAELFPDCGAVPRGDVVSGVTRLRQHHNNVLSDFRLFTDALRSVEMKLTWF